MKTFLLACVLGCLATGVASYLLFIASLGDLEKHDPTAVRRLRMISFPGFSKGYQPFPWQIREVSRRPGVANSRRLRNKLRAAWITGAIGGCLGLILIGIGLFFLVLELV
jgi:hypothetical protein